MSRKWVRVLRAPFGVRVAENRLYSVRWWPKHGSSLLFLTKEGVGGGLRRVNLRRRRKEVRANLITRDRSHRVEY